MNIIRYTRQKGFSLVSSIFLLVVLSSLAGFMVNVAGVQRATTSLSIEGARVYHAARGGVGLGVRKAMIDGNCGSDSFAVESFTVNVSCNTSGTYTEKGVDILVYEITSKAERGSFGSPDYVSRTLNVTVSTEPP